MARSTSWVFMAFGSMGSMGGWPFALRSNDGIALCQAERSATANWAPADWVQPEMDPVPDAIKVQGKRDACQAAARLVVPGGGPGRQVWQEWQPAAVPSVRRAHGPHPTKLPLPAQNLPIYFC